MNFGLVFGSFLGPFWVVFGPFTTVFGPFLLVFGLFFRGVWVVSGVFPFVFDILIISGVPFLFLCLNLFLFYVQERSYIDPTIYITFLLHFLGGIKPQDAEEDNRRTRKLILTQRN